MEDDRIWMDSPDANVIIRWRKGWFTGLGSIEKEWQGHLQRMLTDLKRQPWAADPTIAAAVRASMLAAARSRAGGGVDTAARSVSASDLRSKMIRLAASMPKGSSERKALLDVLAAHRVDVQRVQG